jgi:hypothetical protein
MLADYFYRRQKKSGFVKPSPLVGEVDRMSVSSFETCEVLFPQAQNCVNGENPSSGASRHLLPQGEKEKTKAPAVGRGFVS